MNICTRQSAFIGPKNQDKLQNAIVAIIGVGALGSASAHLLTRMGVGTLILCDDDVVADHNLGRQHMYTKEDVGEKKVVALKNRLQEIRADITIIVHDLRIDAASLSCCDAATLILDGTDNHVSRRAIDEYSKKTRTPWIHAAAIEDKGTVLYFPLTLTYDDVYQGKTKDQHCEISGVLASSTTMVAALQTHMALLYLTGQDIPQKMFHLQGLEWSSINL